MKKNGKWIHTFCGLCHTNCGMKMLVEDGKIQKVKGDPEHPLTRGYLCPKGAYARQVVYSPQRIKHPMVRRNGRFERISWNEALDMIAGKLIEIKEKYGPEAVVQMRGAPVNIEVRDGFVQLMAAYGSPNATSPAHLCSTPRRTAMQLVLGSRTVSDYENTNCIIVWGANPNDSRMFGERFVPENLQGAIPRAKKRGAKLIVIDPRRTELAAKADEWVNIAVETDLAFALALMHVIIMEKLYDKEFVDNWTVGFDSLSQHVQELTPEWAEKITQIPADTIKRMARTYATTKPALILEGNGLDQHPNVVETVRAIAMLSAITGNIDVPGGNVFAPPPKTSPYPTIRPPLKHLSFDINPLFPRVPMPYVFDAILTGKPYKPRVLITHHNNPLLLNANYKKVREALEQVEMLVVYDILHTATANLATIVLPSTSDFERYAYCALPSFKGGFVVLQDKVIEPVGDARSVFEVEYELAMRLGLEKDFPWTTNEEWVNYKLKPLNITLDDLKKHHVIFVDPPIGYKKYEKNGFKTPTGKVELYSQKLRDINQDPMPVYREPEQNANLVSEFPLVGTTRRPGNYVHTRFRDVPSLRKLQPDPLLRIHPRDAERRDLSNGDLAIIESPEGSISVKTMVTDEVTAGTVIVDFGWGNPWDNGPNVNILTSDKHRCPISGATPNRRFRCEVTKAPAA